MVHALNSHSLGLAETELGCLSSSISKGTWESLGVLFPSLMVFGSVSLHQNHFLAELLSLNELWKWRMLSWAVMMRSQFSTSYMDTS